MSASQTPDHTSPATETAAAETSAKAPARSSRRWPWIAALVVVAALGATGTSIAAASASDAQSELAAVQSDYADLETRAGISQSSLDLIRDHRDRLALELEEANAELAELRAQAGESTPAQQG